MSIYAPQNPVAKARRARTGRFLAVVSLLIGAAVIGPQAFASDGTGGHGGGAGGSEAAVDSYTVGSGETLWSIAAARTPAGHDVRDTLTEIQHLNAMSSTAVDAGEQIFLPVAG
ncbi:hypothetical protein Lsed01_01193 [Demequina sediminis]|uniref:LysM domain-containing protein n=1 Tax=Demequina sediminis TaxID=1930058 RepID=A0ABP9WJ19_9MICO|nr:LysM peptidoglycan-binding domain-containing protein [Demequina sediminis]BDZ61378.1 hypothetical protein GCM10025873_11690 [Demequina sediminis]